MAQVSELNGCVYVDNWICECCKILEKKKQLLTCTGRGGKVDHGGQSSGNGHCRSGRSGSGGCKKTKTILERLDELKENYITVWRNIYCIDVLGSDTVCSQSKYYPYTCVYF